MLHIDVSNDFFWFLRDSTHDTGVTEQLRGRFCTHWRHHLISSHTQGQHSTAPPTSLLLHQRSSSLICNDGHPHGIIPLRRGTRPHACRLNLELCGGEDKERGAPVTLGVPSESPSMPGTSPPCRTCRSCRGGPRAWPRRCPTRSRHAAGGARAPRPWSASSPR